MVENETIKRAKDLVELLIDDWDYATHQIPEAHLKNALSKLHSFLIKGATEEHETKR